MDIVFTGLPHLVFPDFDLGAMWVDGVHGWFDVAVPAEPLHLLRAPTRGAPYMECWIASVFGGVVGLWGPRTPWVTDWGPAERIRNPTIGIGRITRGSVVDALASQVSSFFPDTSPLRFGQEFVTYINGFASAKTTTGAAR